VIGRIFREAAWAPVLVLAWNAVVTRLPISYEVYWLLHAFGGAALAFFFLHAIEILRLAHPLARHAFAFALACSGALAWELGEFAIDQVFGTALQEGLTDTMSDLLFSVCGAALYLAYAAFNASRG
jgi:hypothetical protein